jgi:hypothetical protein
MSANAKAIHDVGALVEADHIGRTMEPQLHKACQRGHFTAALHLIESTGFRDELAVWGPDEAVFDRAVRWQGGEWRYPKQAVSYMVARIGHPIPSWCVWMALVQLYDDSDPSRPLPRGAWKVRWSDGTESITKRNDVRICHAAHMFFESKGLPATPLILVCQNLLQTPEHLRLARALLDRGCAVDLKTASGTALVPNPNSTRPLPSLVAMEILLDHGAAIEQVNSRGETALFLAVERNKFELVRLLLARGAAVDRLTPSGETPLIFACDRGSWMRVARLLLDRGADENRRYRRHGLQGYTAKCIYAMKSPSNSIYRPSEIAQEYAFLFGKPRQIARRRILMYWLPRIRYELIGPRRAGSSSARFAFFYNRDMLRHLVAFLG